MDHARVQGNFGEQRAAGIRWGRCEGTAGQSAGSIVGRDSCCLDQTPGGDNAATGTLEGDVGGVWRTFAGRVPRYQRQLRYHIEGLCRALLMRVQALVEAQGDRIRP